jgi:hypothetical protein
VKGEDLKDFYEILREKEMDYARLRKEVEALRIVAPLLDPEGEPVQGDGSETLDEMITRERAVSEPTASPENATETPAGEGALDSESASDAERKGPLSEGQTQTSWWRRRQSGT